MIFLLFFMIVSASFWDRFREAFWVVFGSTSGAFEGQKVAKMSSEIDAKIGREKSQLKRRPMANESARRGSRRGIKGEVNLPLG